MAESLYTRAAKIVADRKAKRESELNRRKNEVFSRVPRIFEIESELDRYGIRMLRAIADLWRKTSVTLRNAAGCSPKTDIRQTILTLPPTALSAAIRALRTESSVHACRVK